MKMTQLEKFFVNTSAKGLRNVERLRSSLEQLDTRGMHDALELGCGIGVVSAFLAESYGMKVHGTDVDVDQIRGAKQAHAENGRLSFSVQDAARLCFEDNRFDLVVSQNVFHHFPDWPGAVREVARVLRDGGFFIWYDLAVPKLLRRPLSFLSRRAGVYTLDGIRLAFQENGLETHSYEWVRHGPFGHHSFVLRKAPATHRS